MKGIVDWPNPYGDTPDIGTWWMDSDGSRHGRVGSYRKRGVMLDINPKLTPPRLVTWEDFRDYVPAPKTWPMS